LLEIKTLKKEEFSKYTKRIEMNSSDVLGPVQDIINNVRLNKDKALHDYTLKFDKADIEEFKVSQEEIENSINDICLIKF
jgi:histidinol dehydrogenase